VIDTHSLVSMGVLSVLLNNGGATELYECRNCGEKLAEVSDECPSCRSHEIAHYEF